MIQPAVILAAVLASLIAAMSLAEPAKPEKPAPPEKVKSGQASGPCRRGRGIALFLAQRRMP